jgi:hypothetical protein
MDLVLTSVLLTLFAAAGLSGFGAVLCFIRAGYWSDRRDRGRARGSHDRLALILGLDLDEVAHRHWTRAWHLTTAFLVLWAAAFLIGVFLIPLGRS